MDRGTRLWLFPSSLLLLILLSIYILSPRNVQPVPHTNGAIYNKTFHAPRHNIWSELSEDEATVVNGFVIKERPDLNLTRHPKSAQENFIYSVEALRPNKTDAVPYLYGNGRQSDRWAKVAISEVFPDGKSYMVFYRVGPLPVSQKTRMLPLSYEFNNGKNYVANPVSDYSAILEFGIAFGANISDITQDLLGARVDSHKNPQDQEGLTVFPRATRVESNGLKLWMQYFRPGTASDSMTLLPQGLFVRVDATNLDHSQWTAHEVYYDGILYANEAAFRGAWKSSDFEKPAANVDGEWTDAQDFDAQPQGRWLSPPLSMQPFGARYWFDRKERFVSWFGFEFYLTTSPATGVSLFDIRFKGQRVMYELGLQEALAHYAGNDPLNGGQAFLNTFFGMGSRAFELVAGYDCPAYADYLDFTWHQKYQTHRIPSSICMFEFTADHLLSRHTAEYTVTASRNTYLVIRWVSTTGNADYTFDYIFYQDGTIEVKVRTSGFLFGEAFHANHTHGVYGHRVHDALLATVTDHVINFKADLDVAGAPNDLIRLSLEPQVTRYPWDQPDGLHTRSTMHLKETPVTHETPLDWPANSREHWLVASPDLNAWGERKAYRIAPGTGVGVPAHLTIADSPALGNGARWAEHDLWVLRRKDSEPKAADPLNVLAPRDPLVDFAKMADGESLAYNVSALKGEKGEYDGDLVVYFNLGTHHLPTAEDIPNVLMHTHASAVMFVPHNFLDRDASRVSAQGVRLRLKEWKGRHGEGEEEEKEMQSDHGDGLSSGDLRKRDASSESDRHDKGRKTDPRYFGQSYEEGLKLTLDDLEPDLELYRSSRNAVTDLGWSNATTGGG